MTAVPVPFRRRCVWHVTIAGAEIRARVDGDVSIVPADVGYVTVPDEWPRHMAGLEVDRLERLAATVRYCTEVA